MGGVTSVNSKRVPNDESRSRAAQPQHCVSRHSAQWSELMNVRASAVCRNQNFASALKSDSKGKRWTISTRRRRRPSGSVHRVHEIPRSRQERFYRALVSFGARTGPRPRRPSSMASTPDILPPSIVNRSIVRTRCQPMWPQAPGFMCSSTSAESRITFKIWECPQMNRSGRRRLRSVLTRRS